VNLLLKNDQIAGTTQFQPSRHPMLVNLSKAWFGAGM